MRVGIVQNSAAGSGESDRLAPHLRALGIEVVMAGEDRSLSERARDLIGTVDAIAACGGDGTVNAVAAVLVDTETPLAVVPQGTLNHFAKDLGMPEDLAEAAGVIAARVERRVDVGEVNGHVYVNNSSIGAYPRATRLRDELNAGPVPLKWPAMAAAALHVFVRFPTLRVRIDGGPERETSFVFVGNNAYDLTSVPPGGRSSLTGGELMVACARTSSRLATIRAGLRAALGRLEEAPEVDVIRLAELEIDVRERSLDVSLDGEVVRMQAPLVYRVRPQSLRVLVPPDAA